VVPSSDVWIVPSLLTLTSNPLDVVVEVLSLFAHEMIVKQKQKIRKTWHHRPDGYEFEQAPRDSKGQGSLGCCIHKELDTSE